MEWLIYGKRTLPWRHPKTHKEMPPDKTFRALDAYGVRVNKLEQAMSYATKEDAEEVIKRCAQHPMPGVVFEIRKAH